MDTTTVNNDEVLVQAWQGTENVKDIAARLGLDRREILQEWKRLRKEKKIVGYRGNHNTYAKQKVDCSTDTDDGRPRIDADPLLTALRREHPEKDPLIIELNRKYAEDISRE
jgi:N6-adenosine-specific RNA methylase IME4